MLLHKNRPATQVASSVKQMLRHGPKLSNTDRIVGDIIARIKLDPDVTFGFLADGIRSGVFGEKQ